MSEPPLPSNRNEPDTSLNQDRHVGVGRDVVESMIVTGDRNIIGNQNLVVQGNYIQAPSTPRSLSEQRLLSKVKAEVASRLRQSLHKAICINLNKEFQPQQIIGIGDAEVKVGDRSSEPLPIGTTILQVFDRPDIAGKLLILGKPGSGKTTTQLELAQALIERSEQNINAPIPVLFNLSFWQDERQSINDWLVAELQSKYKEDQTIGKKWLKECRLLPLLDGLDELKSQQQEPCIHALNQFAAGDNAPLQLVVCSRLEEYERLDVQLQLNGAICLKELTDNQIQAYLTKTYQQDLWQVLRQDATLLALLRAPLLLSITVLVYQKDSLHKWQTLSTTQERLQCLLDTFIQQRLEQAPILALSKNSKTYTQHQARRWLTWLAQQLERESQTEFLIERMQPSWLSSQKLLTTYRHQLKLLVGLIIWLIVGLVVGLSIGLTNGLLAGLNGGLSGGLFAAVLFIWLSVEQDSIVVSESLTWSWTQAKEGLLAGPIVGLTAGLFFGLSGSLAMGLSSGYTIGLFAGLFFGLSTLFSGLLMGLRSSEAEQKSFPNQGIWKTLQSSLVRLLIIALTLGPLGGLSLELINKVYGVLPGETFPGMLNGLFLGIISGLAGGIALELFAHLQLLPFSLRWEPLPNLYGAQSGSLKDCIKHLSLRIVLHRNRYTPWNYAQFLDYCTDRLLLQRVGGRYRFMHKLLQEHFAAMPFEKP